MFPIVDMKRYSIISDEKFVLDFLLQEKVLLVQVTGVNWPEHDHFRIVFLPNLTDLRIALDRFEYFLSNYSQKL